MDTIFRNSENNKTSKPNVLILKLTDKLDLRRGEKGIALSNISIYYTWKAHTIIINLKYQLQHGVINSNYQIDHILYHIFKIICVYIICILRKRNENIDNPSIKIYVNKIENRITFKIKTGCYLVLLTTETMILPGSTENKINKDKNGETLKQC